MLDNGIISNLTGIYEVNVLINTGAIGHRFENWFLNELNSFMDPMSCYYKTYFWRTHSGQEVDFVARPFEGQPRIVQVCFDARNPETYEREKSALAQAEAELGLTGSLITPANYLSFLKHVGDRTHLHH